MIADPLPLSAEEINHVTINLVNHQFHTVPSKFSNQILTSPITRDDPKWPQMTPNDLEINKSFRRCLSLCSPGMMNSRMRGLRERNRSVNDYNIPKKDLNPALMDQPDLTGDFKRMLSLPSTTSGKHQDLKVIWPLMTSIWPLLTKHFFEIGHFWPNCHFWPKYHFWPNYRFLPHWPFLTENNNFFSISTVQPLSIFKMVSTTSKQPSSTPDIHTNIKAVTSKAPSTSTLSKWLKTTFSDPMDWPIRTWKPTKMIQLDRRKNAWLYFIANFHQNELQQCYDSSEKWTEQKTDIQRLTSRNYISSKTATR